MATDAPPNANGESAPAPAPEKMVKPPKPDEDAFKKALNQAEKEHKAVMVKFVCLPPGVPPRAPAWTMHCLAVAVPVAELPLTVRRTP